MDERAELAQLIREMTPEQFTRFFEEAKPILKDYLRKELERHDA